MPVPNVNPSQYAPRASYGASDRGGIGRQLLARLPPLGV